MQDETAVENVFNLFDRIFSIKNCCLDNISSKKLFVFVLVRVRARFPPLPPIPLVTFYGPADNGNRQEARHTGRQKRLHVVFLDPIMMDSQTPGINRH